MRKQQNIKAMVQAISDAWTPEYLRKRPVVLPDATGRRSVAQNAIKIRKGRKMLREHQSI
jgi:hypothetical protein